MNFAPGLSEVVVMDFASEPNKHCHHLIDETIKLSRSS